MAGLFDCLDPPGIRVAAPPLKSPSRLTIESFQKLPDPWGKPDKRGKYEYQKIHDMVSALPVRTQDVFHEIILMNADGAQKPLFAVLKKFYSVTVHDREDYHRVIGRF